MENTYNIQMRIKEIQNEKKRTDKLYKLSLIMFIPIIPLFFIGVSLEEPFLMKIVCALFFFNFHLHGYVDCPRLSSLGLCTGDNPRLNHYKKGRTWHYTIQATTPIV